jgi:integrase/recombinase XerD
VSKKRIEVDWKKGLCADDIKPAVRRFRRYLEENGLRASTIPMYVSRVSKYLEFSQKESPSSEDFVRFRDHLLDMKLSRSTINNYSFSMRKYHEMLGQQVSFNFIKPSNTIPHFFDELEIIRIFNACYNIKHLAMLKTMFYASLRATELCNLDDSDVDSANMHVVSCVADIVTDGPAS